MRKDLYAYDNRGNLIREEIEGKLIHGYAYGAMNRLSRSWNEKGQEASYLYNGLGQRTGKSVNGEEEYPQIWQDVAIQATVYNL